LHEAGQQGPAFTNIQDELEQVCVRRIVGEGQECLFVRRWCTALLSALLDWQVQLVVQKIPKVNGRSHVARETNGLVETTLEDLILELKPLFPLLEGLGVDLEPIALHTPDRVDHLIRMGIIVIGLPELLELMSDAHSRLDRYSDVFTIVQPELAERLLRVFAEVPFMFVIRLLRVAARNKT
jgi:hypothetical protein